MFNRMGFVVAISVFVLIILGCDSLQDVPTRRENRAKKAEGDIIIAAVSTDRNSNSLWNGIALALDEINQAGGVLNRKLRIFPKNDEDIVTKGRLIAYNLSQNLDIVAVIGHMSSYISCPASAIYESSGIVMLSPRSTSPELTKQGYHLIFRNIPNDDEIGKQIANLVKAQGRKRCAILYVKNDYGKGLANAFERQATLIGLTIVDRLNYTKANDKYFEDILTIWKDMDFDSIFLAGNLDEDSLEPAVFIKKAREMGIQVPIYGGDGIDSVLLWKIAGRSANNTIVPSFFNPNDPRSEVQKFRKAYFDRYKFEPDSFSAQGYDAVKLIAKAIEKNQSTQPSKMADALHHLSNYPGSTCIYTFNMQGDIVDCKIQFKEVRNQQFVYLPSF